MFFLDEFIGEPCNVLLRNLARTVGLRCIVANTNSDIGNLTGHSQSLSSRGEMMQYQVWSVIFSFLNSVDWDKTFGQHVDEHIERIINSVNIHEKETFKSFFNAFKTEYAPIMLPGIVGSAARFIKSFVPSSDTHTQFLSFFNEFIQFLGFQISGRKTRIVTTVEGVSANYGLFLNYAYENRENEMIHHINAHRKSYLMNHLYFLVNPVDLSKSSFLVFKPDQGGSMLNPLKIYKDQNYSEWRTERTYFQKNDLFTILACLSIASKSPIALNFQDAENADLRKSISPKNISNPNALKSDGNSLEVLAAVTSCASSHHEFGKCLIDFTGQHVHSFIKNIAFNMILKRGIDKININWQNGECSASARSFLDGFQVPFLFPLNCQVPKFLQKLTNEGIINVGECKRTADKTEIDILFEVIEQAHSDTRKRKITGKTSYCGVAEFKNWNSPVKYGDLKLIIDKALKQTNCVFNLIFCDEVIQPEETSKQSAVKSFVDFCKKRNIHVFRFKKINIDDYEIVPYIDTFISKDINVKMVTFIYDLNDF